MMSNMHYDTLYPTNKNLGAPPEQIFFSDDIYVFKKFVYSRRTGREGVGGKV
jgi:hypothetical protein